jgi:hypothetical protein
MVSAYKIQDFATEFVVLPNALENGADENY